MDTRTKHALLPLVEAITSDLEDAADRLDGIIEHLTSLRLHVGWCGDLPAALNGLRDALGTHADTLRDEARAVVQRMTSAPRAQVREQTDEELAHVIRLQRGG